MKRNICLLLSAVLLINITGCETTSIKRKTNEDQTLSAETESETQSPMDAPSVTTVNTEDNSDVITPSSNEYKDVLKEMVDSKSTIISEAADKTMESVGNSYDSYTKNKDSLSGWYDLTLKESKDLYDSIKSKNIEQYKEIASDLSKDPSYDWDSQMDDIYKAWDDAMGDYYRDWDDLYGDIYDAWDDAIGNNDGIDYSTSSSVWSDAYSTHSDAWSAQYSIHSDAWSELYGIQSGVWSGLYSGDTDIDALIEKSIANAESEKKENSISSDTTDTEKTNDSQDNNDTGADAASDDDLIRDDIKEAIDSYEAFVDEYCEFMKNYDPSDINSLTKYTDLINKEIEMSKEFKDIENMKLTTAEALYYSEVSLRCSKKMMETASKINTP